MNRLNLRFAILIGALFLLNGCFQQKTPQEVSQGFWQAVINNDSNEVINYSTLTENEQYEAFPQDWSDSQVSWGKLVIEADRANIETIISRPDGAQANSKKYQTYLIQQNEEWTVDYARTRNAIKGDVFNNMFEQLSQFSDNLSEQFKSSSDDFNADMQRMGKELETLSESISQQTTESLNRYTEALRESLKALAESVERAIEEHKDRLSNKDKRVMIRVADDLHQGSENLSSESIQSITEGSKSLGRAQLQLNAIDNKTIRKYKEQWNQRAEKLEEDLQKILNEITSKADAQYYKRSI